MSEPMKPISTTKLLIARAVDTALISALALGNEDGKTFAFWMISMMVAVLFIGSFTISKDSAITMASASSVRKDGRTLVQFAYVLALVYAGFPVLAALYAMSVIVLILQIDAKSKLETQT